MSRNMVILIILILLLSIAPIVFYKPPTRPLPSTSPTPVSFNVSAKILSTQPQVFFLGYSNSSDKSEVESLLADINHTTEVTLSSYGYLFRVGINTEDLPTNFRVSYLLSKVLSNVVGYKYGVVTFDYANKTFSVPALLLYSRYENMTIPVYCKGYRYGENMKISECYDTGKTYLYGLTYEQFLFNSQVHEEIIKGKVIELGEFLLKSDENYSLQKVFFNGEWYYKVENLSNVSGEIYRIVRIDTCPCYILAPENISIGDEVEADVNITSVFGIDIYGYGISLNPKP